MLSKYIYRLDIIHLICFTYKLFFQALESHSMYKLIEFSNLGIIHTGQLAEVLKGCIVTNFSKKLLRELGSAYSERFIDRVKTKPSHFSNFAELEISTLYQRGFNGTNSGFLSAQRHSETISPFCDVDFFEYCLSIPLKSRVHHKIYKMWILKKYPKVAEYVWEHTKQKFNDNTIYVSVGEKRISINTGRSSL
jgi:asparagine synthase (glutamine-hydrolysing)